MLTYDEDNVTNPYDEIDFCLHLSSTTVNDTYRLNNMPIIPGEYTFSVWGKSSGENSINMNILGTMKDFTLSSSWNKIEATVISDGTCSYIDIILPANIEVWLYEGQLEDGNVATSWHLAPEDINTSIEKAKEYADNLFSGVTDNSSELAQLKDTVLTWTNGAIGKNTRINGGWLDTNTVTAEKIALSDFTNYVTVNESNEATVITSNHPFANGNTSISDGYIIKSIASAEYLALSNYCMNPFNDGDELYYSFTIKGTADGTCKLGVCFYGDGSSEDKTYKVGYLSDTHSFTTSETTYSGTIKLNTCKTYGYYAIGIQDLTTTKSQIYIKDVSVRRRYGGELIVDGSITADKITVDNLSAITANIGQLIIDGYLTTNSNRTTYNQAASGITIDANGIGGWGSSSKYFNLSKDGQLTAVGIDISGKITATSGTIGGWNIYSTCFYSSQDGGSIYITSKSDSSIYWIRTHDAASGSGNRTFSVSKTGELYAIGADISGKITASSGKIGNWTIGTALYYSSGGSTLSSTTANTAYIGTDGLNFYQSSSAYFKVTTSTGKLQCAGADISGKITATDGKIGNWTINTALYSSSGGSTLSSTTAGTAYVGVDGLNFYQSSSAYFKVITSTGKLTCTGADISGKITATEGKIGNWTIGTALYNSSGGNSISSTTSGTAYIGTDGLNFYNSSSAYFKVVTSSGKLQCAGADISGKITATEGKIGNWTIGTALYNSGGGSTLSSTTANTAYIGTDGLNFYQSSSAYFKVTTSTGKLVCTGADISGKITSTTGTIGGWTITDGKIYAGDSNTKVAVMQRPQDSTTFVFAAGGTSHSSYSDCPFRVTKDGKLYANRLYVTGDPSTDSGEGFYIYDPTNEKYLVLAKCDGGIIFPAFSYQFTGLLEINKLASGIKLDTADVYDLGDGSNHFRTIYARSLRIGCENYSTDNGAIYTRWKDGSPHDILVRSSDGLTCSVGWAGSSSYSSVTQIRGQTVKYTNSSGTSTLSDVRMKKDFEDLGQWEDFYMNIEPCAFKYINGSSGRKHIGFAAQQIQSALEMNGLTTQDFAGFVEYNVDPLSDEWNGYDKEYGLIYTEFVALNTYMIQKLMKQINALESEIALLKKEAI